MITKVKPDKQKSESLKKMAEITLERLNNTDMEKYPNNTLLDYYDVVHNLMEALTLKEGIKIIKELHTLMSHDLYCDKNKHKAAIIF
ncbi:MAG: hypothetical protein ABIH82_04930 [Candidatus Woesearchaeota archaeon]